MKITRRQLRQIIKEELGRLNEDSDNASSPDEDMSVDFLVGIMKAGVKKNFAHDPDHPRVKQLEDLIGSTPGLISFDFDDKGLLVVSLDDKDNRPEWEAIYAGSTWRQDMADVGWQMMYGQTVGGKAKIYFKKIKE